MAAAHSKKAIQSLFRHTTANNCMLLPGSQSCVIATRCFADKFDITKITRSNRENSSLDGIKKVRTKTVKAKVQPSESKIAEPAVAVPDCFTVLLDLPLSVSMVKKNSKYDNDLEKLNEFKQKVEEMNIKYLPSVSTVLKETQSPKQKEVLEKWKLRKTQELGGEKQFEEHQRETLDTGLNLHECIESRLKGETDIKIQPRNEGHWRSVTPALKSVSDVRMIEENCVHSQMFYQGKFDCVAEFRDTLCLIEWKTSSKVKPLLSQTYDNPLQVVAYMGAVNSSGRLEQYNIPDLLNGAVVFAYPTGEPATVHMMHEKMCMFYWKQWVERLYTYWAMRYQATVSV